MNKRKKEKCPGTLLSWIIDKNNGKEVVKEPFCIAAMADKVVSRVLELEGLQSTDFQTTFQTVYFNQPFHMSTCKLIEMPQELIELVESGEKLTIRGDWDYSNLCTIDQSFTIAESHVPGNYAILEHSPLPDDNEQSDNIKHTILSMDHSILTLSPSNLNVVGHLYRTLFPESKVNDDDEDDTEEVDVIKRKVTIEELLENVPTSRAEILKGLDKMFYTEDNGVLEVFDSVAIERITGDVLKIVQEDNISLSELDERVITLRLIETHSAACLSRWFQTYTEQSEHRDQHRRLDVKKISLLYADVILKPAIRFVLRDFVYLWRHSVPTIIPTNLEDLNGLAIVHEDEKPPYVEYMPVYEMPDLISERFKLLFRHKSKWTMDQLKSYMTDPDGGTKTLEQLLEKHCRATTTAGQVCFYKLKFPMW